MDLKKIFLTSDTFFGRDSTAKERGYPSSNEMDNDLIKKWNDRVSKNDTVYHLGNFAWDPISAASTLSQLNGNIIFLLANYDKAIEELVNDYTFKITDKQIVEIFNFNAVLCHYPLEEWNGKENGTIHLHGHSKKVPTDISKMNRINVCCDCWGLSPISLSFIHEIIQDFKNLSK